MNSLRESLMIFPALSLYYLITEHMISCNKAEGRSMEPTIRSNDVIVVNRMAYKNLKKNDIIIAQSPNKPNLDICKRVLYLQGEYVPDFGVYVPHHHVWVEGDNKNESYDSRHYGPVPIGLVHGKVSLILFNLFK